MAKLTFLSIVFLLATLSSFVLTFPIEPRSVSGFETDLDALSAKINDLYNTMGTVGDYLTIQQGLEIRDEVQAIEDALNQTNSDVKNIHQLSQSDSHDIIVNREGSFIPKFVDILNALVQKKNAFEPYASIIEEELQTLHNGFMMLTEALIKLATSGTKSKAQDLEMAIHKAFMKAISAYSS